MVELRKPRNKAELREAITECWEQIPLSYIRSCILGLLAKMEKAITHAIENPPENSSEF